MFTRPPTAAESLLIDGAEEKGESWSAPDDQPEPEARPKRSPRACVLLVEDDFLVGMEMETGLQEAGYEVAGVAATAEEAVELARARRPAVVVMDIRLASERDGVEAAIEIFEAFGIRSLFASAHCDALTRTRAEAAFPLGWVAKPYRVETLLKAVEEALGQC